MQIRMELRAVSKPEADDSVVPGRTQQPIGRHDRRSGLVPPPLRYGLTLFRGPATVVHYALKGQGAEHDRRPASHDPRRRGRAHRRAAIPAVANIRAQPRLLARGEHGAEHLHGWRRVPSPQGGGTSAGVLPPLLGATERPPLPATIGSVDVGMHGQGLRARAVKAGGSANNGKQRRLARRHPREVVHERNASVHLRQFKISRPLDWLGAADAALESHARAEASHNLALRSAGGSQTRTPGPC